MLVKALLQKGRIEAAKWQRDKVPLSLYITYPLIFTEVQRTRVLDLWSELYTSAFPEDAVPDDWSQGYLHGCFESEALLRYLMPNSGPSFAPSWVILVCIGAHDAQLEVNCFGNCVVLKT